MPGKAGLLQKLLLLLIRGFHFSKSSTRIITGLPLIIGSLPIFFSGLVDRAVRGIVQHENQRHAFALVAFGLDHGGNADF